MEDFITSTMASLECPSHQELEFLMEDYDQPRIPPAPFIKIGTSDRGLRNLKLWPTQITPPPPQNWNFLWRTSCGELCVEPDTGSLQTLFNGRHLISRWNHELINRTPHPISFHPYSVSTVILSYPVQLLQANRRPSLLWSKTLDAKNHCR